MTSDGNVVLFEPRLRAKKQMARLGQEVTKKIDESGWTLADPVKSPGSEVCVYLLDADNGTALAFGNSFSDYATCPAGEWCDLVNAWDVVADPDLCCDKAHLEVTAELARRAIAFANLLPEASAISDGQRLHLILVIDREDLEAPLASVPAISNAPIMNATSVRAILNRWLEES